MLGENGGDGIGMLAGSPQPDADGLVRVPSDLLSCTYTASTHDHEQCLCSFGGRGMQAIHRGADCFPKEEAAASTFVSSSAFAAAIAKNAGVLASRIGTSGDRWFFHAIQPSSFPLYHFHQESLPGNGESGLFVTPGSYTKAARNFEKGKSNLHLVDGEELVNLILAHYEQFDPRYQGLLPLKKVYVPEPVQKA